MRSLNSLKTVQDVISYYNQVYTFNNCVINYSDILNLLEITSWPHNLLINLLGSSRKVKAQIIQHVYREYQNGKNIVLICSLSISSNTFQSIVRCVSNLTFISGRIYDNNKRYDTTIVLFVHYSVFFLLIDLLERLTFL